MLLEINDKNHHVHLNLLQAYEAEFSSITKKLPNENGCFELDTIHGGDIKGFIWYDEKKPVGFILIDVKSEPFNVSEFYVIPSCRNKKIGQELFFQVLKKFPGQWQVKQINGATKATIFWRKVLSAFTKNNFTEDIYDDKHWGRVTRQRFISI